MLVKVTGADQALKALRKMEPLTAREIGREVSAIGRMIVGRASAPAIAMNNWRTVSAAQPYQGSRSGSGGWPAYDIGKPRSRRRGMEVFVSHTSAAGAIYESAGIKNPYGVDPRGRGFINQLPALPNMSSKRSGRYLRRALAASYPKAIEDLDTAANKAADAVNRLMP